MLRIHLLTAWRNLKKNRMVSTINILGLSVGLTCAVLAIIYSYNELTYEDCHKKADRICRIYLSGDFGEIKWAPITWGPEGFTLKNMFPEIERNSISRNVDGIVRVGNNLFIEKKILFADSDFFSILTIPFVEGTPSADPQSVTISQKTAFRYFGHTNAIGKVMVINSRGQKFSLTVTGIFKDLPSNTEVQSDFIIPFTAANRFGDWKYHEYESTSYNSIVLLKPGTDLRKLNEKIAIDYKIPSVIANIKAFLMPIKKVHLNGNFDNNYGKLLAFLIGGLLVLIISCINYINLANILFSTRFKEVGVRMVNGAKRINVFWQLIFDTAFTTATSFLLSFLLLQFIVPEFNAIMDSHISLSLSGTLVVISVFIFVVTVLFSGVYPALKISTSKSIEFFRKPETSYVGKNRSLWFLTTFQFIIAIIFLQVILVINNQNKRLSNSDTLGFNPENVICINGNVWGDLKNVKQELLRNPAIVAVSWANALPSTGMNLTTDWKEKGNKISANQLFADEDYMKVYQINMFAGRFFSKEYTGDFEDGIVINKETAQELGYTDPVGKLINAFYGRYRIIGVVGEYMSVPPIFKTMPQLIRPSKPQAEYLLIRINPNEKIAAFQHIRQILQKFNPDYPVELRYHLEVTEEIAKSYYSATKLMNTFSIITIITALFGLFGLSIFIAEKSRKEIGIRKVCGASFSQIITKLSKGLVIQVIIAMAFATPLAFTICQKYLSMFPSYYDLNVFLLVEGGLVTLMLMFFTVSWQSWRAAHRNPVESLRYE